MILVVSNYGLLTYHSTLKGVNSFRDTLYKGMTCPNPRITITITNPHWWSHSKAKTGVQLMVQERPQQPNIRKKRIS